MNPAFSKIAKIALGVACIAAVSLSAVRIYEHRAEIQKIARDVAYLIRLPFEIKKLASAPPDETFFMPVYGATVRRVTDTWHAPRSEGRKHEGQDIFAKKGTPVYAAVPGYIIFIGHDELGGNVVLILGAGNRRYYYAHLESFHPDIALLKHVDTNSMIGYVGNTGNAATTPPHLHFGVYGREGAIDPLPLLRDREKW